MSGQQPPPPYLGTVMYGVPPDTSYPDSPRVPASPFIPVVPQPTWPSEPGIGAIQNIFTGHSKRELDLLERITKLSVDLGRAEAARDEAFAKLNTPELHDFSKAVILEAAHQRDRWGSEHDAGKTDADWFWLVGYLAGKVLSSIMSGNIPKAMHHTISTAAALANWHAALNGDSRVMRPGIETPVEGEDK